MQIKCACGNVVKTNADNTVVNTYAKPKYNGRCSFDHALIKCKGHVLRYFANSKTLEKLVKEGCELKSLDYPDKVTMKTYGELMECEAPKVYQLTKRLDDMCIKFGNIMAAMPADLLYEELTTSRPKRFPEKWI